jgi:hypothetical protein
MFGLPVELYDPCKQAHNVRTGKVDRTYNVYKVKRAVVMPYDQIREFVYDLAFIAANRNFTSGGLFDESKRTVIIDARDLPKEVQLNLNWHIQFKNKRWELVAIHKTEDDTSWFLTCKELSNSEIVNG